MRASYTSTHLPPRLPAILRTGFLLLALISGCMPASAASAFRFGSSIILLADSSLAARYAAGSDAYTRALSPFDLSIRLGKDLPHNEAGYLNLAAREVRNWPQQEAEQLRKGFGEIEAFLVENEIHLSFPDTLFLVKTTGIGEFGAEGYTRENRIFLHTEAAALSTHLLAHELFHVYSRYQAGKRDSVYRIFGFHPTRPIHYAVALKGRIITNPDCPEVAHFIRANTPSGRKDLALILYSKREPLPGEGLMELMEVGLLMLEGPDEAKTPALHAGEPTLYELGDVPDILRQIGPNTRYLLHPEEISAEHFALMITGEKVPKPIYIRRMKEILKH